MNRKTITKEKPCKICFVCLGNICRSPTAEGILQHLVNEKGLSPFFYIESAGTSAYHIGEPANSKSREVAGRHGIKLNSRAQRFEPEDLNDFDLVLAMDHENLSNLKRLSNGHETEAAIRLLRDFDPETDTGEVPDPYFGGINGFENVFQIVYRSCESLLNELEPLIDN